MCRFITAVCAVMLSILAGTCGAQANRVEPRTEQVLFVCQHGNVKSLMAASYFNRLSAARGLPFRAISRGTAPDSTTVPAAIAKALGDDGFDVRSFQPSAVTKSDVSASDRVITINTDLPAHAVDPEKFTERWDDVPVASLNYPAASASLKAHVENLLEQLAGQ